MSIGNGLGSEYGNYAAQRDGEMRDAAGDRCIVFSWDRPLTNDLAIRERSASCASKGHPGRMISREISHTVIPMAQSTLRDEKDEAAQ